MKKITIKDIAKEVGLSFKTVSRVINNEKHVSEKTREKVNEVLKKYDFSINYSAKNLNKLKTNQILLISNIENKELPLQKNNMIVKSIVEYAKKKGYSIILNNKYSELDKTSYGTYEKGYFDGAIILNPREYEFIEELEKANKPFIISGISDRFNFVGTDQDESAYLATKHLLEEGCRVIYLLLNNKESKTSLEKIKGYIKALEEYNITDYEDKIIYGITHSKDVEDFLENQRIKNEIPEGVIVNSDYVALGCIRFINKYNIPVPEKLKIITFGDTYICEEVYPRLTAIKQDFDLIGKKLVDILVDNIEEKNPIENYVIKAKIIIRESTKK